MEPTNDLDKYTMAVCNEGDIVDHLPKGKTGKFTKMIFHFLKSEMVCACKVSVAGKKTNFDDEKGLRIPSLLHIDPLKKLLGECNVNSHQY